MTHSATTNNQLNYLYDRSYALKAQQITRENQAREAAILATGEDVIRAVETKKGKRKGDVNAARRKDVLAQGARLKQELTAASRPVPRLALPKQGDAFGLGSDPIMADDGQNFITVMGEAMVAGIRCGQSMYQFDWQATSADWQNQVAHAPLIEEAICASGQAQANATNDEAYMSKYDGITNLSFGGLSIVMGGYGAYDDARKEAEKTAAAAAKTSQPLAASEKATLAEVKNASQSMDRASQSMDRAAKAAKANAGLSKNMDMEVRAAANAEKAIGGKGTLKKMTETVGSGMKKVYEGFSKTAQIAMGMSMFSQGITGVSVDSPKKSDEATQQREAQTQQAFSESFQLHASGYGEHYNKGEDARQSVSQAIELFLNLYQQLPNTITQALATYRAA